MRHARDRRARASIFDDRSARDIELDLEVGISIEGYAWVEWNRTALGEAPLYEPGRFVGHPGDLLAHLYVSATEETPLAGQPYARLPRYSLEPGPALRAAERAGLFGDPGVSLSCSTGGAWRLSAGRWGVELDDDCLPRLLAQAALRVAHRDLDERAP
jgi:hypothetical protein